MPYIERMIAAESNTSGSKDEMEMLVSARSMRQLGRAIIDLIYNNHNALFNRMINPSPNINGEYNFGIVQHAFAEYLVASTKLNKGKPRYFLNGLYTFNGIGLYLSGEWYAVYSAQPVVHQNWPSINDLIRVLNTCFNACFVYIKTDNGHQLWGPSGTL